MPRKGENIYHRKDGRWEGRYIIEKRPNQRARYGYIYGKTYREVKKKLREIEHNPIQSINSTVASRQSEEPSCIILRDMGNSWLRYKEPQIKESTLNKYTISMEKYIYPSLGDIPVKYISKKIVEEFSHELLCNGGCRKQGLSSKTVTDILNILSNIMKYSADHGVPVRVENCNVRIRQNPGKMQVLTIDEQQILCDYLLSHMNERNLGILISLFTGLRIGELCALRWENISIESQKIYICQTLQRIYTQRKTDTSKQKTKTCILISTPKSICSIRTIPLPDQLVKIMKDYYHPSGYLLTGLEQQYIEPRSFQNHFHHVLKETGIEGIHFHTLRHTFATRCVELGFDIKTLSEILGHANVNITMNRYVHPSMKLKRENMDRLNELLTVK